jgi:hypothetical protein
MPSRIKISISSNPAHGNQLVFSVQNVAILYSSTQAFTFVNGTPVNSNQIKIGATAADTLQNMYFRFQTAFPALLVSIDNPDIFLDFPTPGDATVTILVNTTAGAIGISAESFTVVDPEPEAVFEIADFSIQLIDTYDNDRTLEVEITRESAPKLIFDSGDSILEPLMTSELKFDMRVPGAEDAYFKHLFTGDEKRFKVKLNAIDAEENVKLLWQGFLLPDLYREPYKNENLFVEFSATDMIGTLKEKFFKPWEYNRKINIMRLLGEIMAQTGLTQKFVVMPALVPDSALIPWYHLNLELSVYFDGKKGENLYELLSSVLKSNLLTLRSFENYWWVEGFQRKFEQSGTALLFDENGVFESNFDFERSIKQLNFSRETLFYTAKSPLKNVFINYSGKQNENIFPDDIVDREAFFGTWNDNEWDQSKQTTSYLMPWIKVGMADLEFKNALHKLRFGNKTTISENNYSCNEANALNNYFQSPFFPYVLPGVQYRLKMEVLLTGYYIIQSGNSNILDHINAGRYDQFFVYQMKVGDTEILSNRPSFENFQENQFFVTYESKELFLGPFVHKLKFVLDTRFETDVEGNLDFRILQPITQGLGMDFFMFDFVFDVNKLEIVYEDEISTVLTAERPVNFTASYEQDLKILSSNDVRDSGSFGLGLQLTPYQQNIPVGTQTYVENVHTFNSNAINKLFSWRFEISYAVQEILFRKLLKNSIFITRANGDQEFFNSVYTKTIPDSLLIPREYLYYLTDRLGNPKFPKEYRFLDKIEAGDVLTILLSNYPEEDLAQRLAWRVYDEAGVDTFVRTLAKIIHQMHSENYYGIEGTLLGLFFPGEIVQQYYDGDLRDFVASRIEIDLFNSKSTISGREIKYDVLTDISYE